MPQIVLPASVAAPAAAVPSTAPIDIPAFLLPQTPAERARPDQPIFVAGERDAFLASLRPSPYPEGVVRGGRGITAMQWAARDKVQARESYVLTAPTSSGKTLAAAAPIFERGGPAVFVYPYRALLYDQASELLRIGQAFGYSQQDFGYLYGGVTGEELVRQVAHAKFLLTTPDKLISLLLGSRQGASAAMVALASADFFFDEIHAYNAMMIKSLIYFIRSVRLWQERMGGALGAQEPPCFCFASATIPTELLAELEQGLGITARDIITGPSFTGDATVEILVPRSSRTRGVHPIAQDMRDRGRTTDAMVILDSPFDAWMLCSAGVLDRSALLFVGQDKQAEAQRHNHLKAFAEAPCKYALVGSSAIEAGVDLGATHLFMEESTGNATAQRFGRVARAGQDGTVVYYGNRLSALLARGQLKQRYTRAEFNTLLRAINPERPPVEILAGLAASPYADFWGATLAPRILDPADLALVEHVRRSTTDGHLAFRGLTPYTQYESGERISFRTLFRKLLAVADGKVRGAPNVEHYFNLPSRPMVQGVIQREQDVAHREQVQAVRNGRTMTLHYLLARVDFGAFGAHWTLLEIGPNDAHGADFAPDNFHLSYLGRPLAGPGERMSVRFYS